MQIPPPSVVCPVCKIAYADGEETCRFCGRKGLSFSGLPAGTSALARMVLLFLALGVSAIALTCYYMHSRLVQSDAYKGALAIASSSPELQKILGANIHLESSALGHLQTFGGSEFAEWSVALSGTKSSGHLYGTANRINGIWDYSCLIFQPAGGKERLSLTPARLLSLPRVPPKHVFLIPLGLTESESLDWGPAYYKSKLGIDVTVLPSVPLPPSLVNQQREQLDAKTFVDEFLQQEYPKLTSDASALIIAVTSKDMYISSFDWRYAENWRSEGRFAIVSSARLHPPAFLEKMNPAWFVSRLQKILTKNIAMLYFDLPLSSDYTSLLSGGILTGTEIDRMGEDIIGDEKQWDPFLQSGDPSVSIYDVGGNEVLWNRKWANSAVPDLATQVFSAELNIGVLVQRKADFVSPDEPAMQFTRVYRNQDDRSRAFGIGGTNSFDMFLGGKMGVAVDLIMPDGNRIRFVHKGSVFGEVGDVYEPEPRYHGAFVRAVYASDNWQVKTRNGWIYEFPYRPNALPQYVTVLTGFTDSFHHKYGMTRDSFGCLLEIASPSGAWLRLENDPKHRIRQITSSSGRKVTYEYDNAGSLLKVAASDGTVDSYTYDTKGQMLSASHGDVPPVLTNQYFVDGHIKTQTMRGGQQFEYHYSREGDAIRNSYITDPNGLETYIQYERGGYLEWLPASLPR
jgi:YD repeat-containing protein